MLYDAENQPVTKMLVVKDLDTKYDCTNKAPSFTGQKASELIGIQILDESKNALSQDIVDDIYNSGKVCIKWYNEAGEEIEEPADAGTYAFAFTEVPNCKIRQAEAVSFTIGKAELTSENISEKDFERTYNGEAIDRSIKLVKIPYEINSDNSTIYYAMTKTADGTDINDYTYTTEAPYNAGTYAVKLVLNNEISALLEKNYNINDVLTKGEDGLYYVCGTDVVSQKNIVMTIGGNKRYFDSFEKSDIIFDTVGMVKNEDNDISALGITGMVRIDDETMIPFTFNDDGEIVIDENTDDALKEKIRNMPVGEYTIYVNFTGESNYRIDSSSYNTTDDGAYVFENDFKVISNDNISVVMNNSIDNTYGDEINIDEYLYGENGVLKIMMPDSEESMSQSEIEAEFDRVIEFKTLESSQWSEWTEDNKPVNAGTYDVRVTYTDKDLAESGDGVIEYDTLTASAKMVICPKQIKIDVSGSKLYGDAPVDLTDFDGDIKVKTAEGYSLVGDDTLEDLGIEISVDKNGNSEEAKPGSYDILVDQKNITNYIVDYAVIEDAFKVDKTDASLEVDLVLAEYGEEYEPYVETNARNYKVDYYLNGEEIEKPVDVGEYKYVVTTRDSDYNEVSKEGEISIYPKDITVRITGRNEYGSAEKADINITAYGLAYADTIEDLGLKYSPSENTSELSAGYYDFQIDSYTTKNYNIDIERDSILTISEADVEIIWRNNSDFVYSGSEQNADFEVRGAINGYDVVYFNGATSLGDKKPVDAGTYRVMLYIEDFTDLNIMGSTEINMVINKSAPVIKGDIDAVLGRRLYKVKLDDVKVTDASGKEIAGTLSWVDPTRIVDKSGEYDVVFVPEDTKNYEIVKGSVNVKSDIDIVVTNDYKDKLSVSSVDILNSTEASVLDADGVNVSEYSKSDSTAVFTLEAVNGNISEYADIKLYMAGYNADNGSIEKVVIGESRIENNKLIISAKIPESDTYKIMLWDENFAPVINVIEN